METNEVQLIPITGDIDKIVEVGKESAKGKSNKALASIFGISTREAAKMVEQYRSLNVQLARNNQNYADRLGLALEESLQHFDMLLSDAWENKEDASINQEFSVVNSSLRIIKDITEARFKMLHAMTEGQDAELMYELEEMEQQVEQLMKVLRELKEKFPDAAKFVFKRLNELKGVEIV